MDYSGLRTRLLAAAWCVTFVAAAAPGWALEDWRAEFDAVCSRTAEAMTLTEAELVEFSERCVRLEKVVAGLPETEQKVFGKRLQMCKDLFVFMLESKRHEQSAK